GGSLMPSKFEPQIYIHGSKLRNKAEKDAGLAEALRLYESWREASLQIASRDLKEVATLTDLMNSYKEQVEPIFDSRPNSAQEVLQPSILDEFFEYLFCRIAQDIGREVLRQPEAGYIGLAFNPKSIDTLLSAPEYTIRRKDHDFVIGATIELTISTEGSDAQK